MNPFIIPPAEEVLRGGVAVSLRPLPFQRAQRRSVTGGANSLIKKTTECIMKLTDFKWQLAALFTFRFSLFTFQL
jgi:hypothetical protein